MYVLPIETLDICVIYFLVYLADMALCLVTVCDFMVRRVTSQIIKFTTPIKNELSLSLTYSQYKLWTPFGSSRYKFSISSQ